MRAYLKFLIGAFVGAALSLGTIGFNNAEAVLKAAGVNLAAPGAIGGTTPAAGTFTTLAITAGSVISGTYTPGLTNSTNVAASTSAVAYYTQVGNVVTVSGSLAIDPTAASTPTILRISLPVASSIGASSDANGVGSCQSVFGLTGGITGSVGNGVAALNFVSDGTAGNVAWNYTFQYIVH